MRNTRKGTLRLAAVAVVAAFAATSVAANAAAPTFDSTEGAGTYGLGCDTTGTFCLNNVQRHFTFSAQQRGLGGHATGTYTVDSTNVVTGNTSHFAGRVTCANVLANTAVFAGTITDAPPAPDGTSLQGVPFVAWVVDNGPAGSTPPDLISPLVVLPAGDAQLAQMPPGFPNICPQPFPSLDGYFPVTSGNIVVDDESQPGLTG